MLKGDSPWILQLLNHIDAIMSCTKYDATEDLGVKCTARHCSVYMQE